MPIVAGKPDSRISVEPNSFEAASTSRERLKDAYFGGLMEEQRRDPSLQEEGNSEDSDNPAAGTSYYKGEPVAQNNKAWRNPLAHGASPSVDQESRKEYGSDMGPLPSNIAGHIALDGSRHLHGQEDLWNTTRRSYGRFECEFGHLWEAAVHLGKDFDTSLGKQQDSFSGKQKS